MQPPFSSILSCLSSTKQDIQQEEGGVTQEQHTVLQRVAMCRSVVKCDTHISKEKKEQ